MPQQQSLFINVFKSHPSVRLRVVFSRDESATPYLVKVHADGAAAEAGLQVGDALLEIDGELTTTPCAAAASLRSRSGNITIKALRTIFSHEDFAATVIAARWRGFSNRVDLLFNHLVATHIQRFWRGTLTRWCVTFWRYDRAVVILQACVRGRLARMRMSSMLADNERFRKPLDKKAVNQVRRALSFSRKPRKRGKDGGEFSALLEGSPEDVEARLLMRQQQTARIIEKAMGGVHELAPETPSEEEMADPLVMQDYMFALAAFSFEQETVLQEHEAAVRENRWVGEQLVRLAEEAKLAEALEAVEEQKRVRRALSFERAKNRHKQSAVQSKAQPHDQTGAMKQEAVPREAVPHADHTSLLEKVEGLAKDGTAKEGVAGVQDIKRTLSFERRTGQRHANVKPPAPIDADERHDDAATQLRDDSGKCSPQSVMTVTPSLDEAPPKSAKYNQRLHRARVANQQRAVLSPAIVPALVHPVA